MLQIPLSALPNQSISFNVDGAYWQLHVYQSKFSMCVDITRDGVSVAYGVRCYVGQPLMQYSYMYSPGFGNFVFDSDVDWENFGVSCNLFYLSNSEWIELQSIQAASLI